MTAVPGSKLKPSLVAFSMAINGCHWHATTAILVLILHPRHSVNGHIDLLRRHRTEGNRPAGTHPDTHAATHALNRHYLGSFQAVIILAELGRRMPASLFAASATAAEFLPDLCYQARTADLALTYKVESP